nr:transposase [Elizabethkingia sp. ASV34]
MKDLHSDLLEPKPHLGYIKYIRSKGSNTRNGSTAKQLKTEFGKSIIEVLRDRERSFELLIIPKHQSTAPSVESIIISLHAKGISTTRISENLWIQAFYIDNLYYLSQINKVNQQVLG